MTDKPSAPTFMMAMNYQPSPLAVGQTQHTQGFVVATNANGRSVSVSDVKQNNQLSETNTNGFDRISYSNWGQPVVSTPLPKKRKIVAISRLQDRLPEDKPFDEVLITINHEPRVNMRIYLKERFKDSPISGSEYRYNSFCKLYWKGKVVRKWTGNKVKSLALDIPVLFDIYLYDIPRTKKDERLEIFELQKKRAVEGKIYDSSDDESYEIETEEKAYEYHKGDEEIGHEVFSSYKLLDEREEFIDLVTKTNKDRNCSIEFKRKGIKLDTLELNHNRPFTTALLYASQPPEGNIFPPSKEYEKVFKYLKTICFQPTCPEKYTVEYDIKKIFTKGHEIKNSDNEGFQYYRRFCDKHKNRGDQDREDCNDNYYLVE